MLLIMKINIITKRSNTRQEFYTKLVKKKKKMGAMVAWTWDLRVPYLNPNQLLM